MKSLRGLHTTLTDLDLENSDAYTAYPVCASFDGCCLNLRLLVALKRLVVPIDCVWPRIACLAPDKPRAGFVKLLPPNLRELKVDEHLEGYTHC